MYDAIALGEILIDFTLDRVQDDGYPVMAAHPGGSVANCLAALAKYGKKTALLCKAGNDALGRQLRETIRAANIDDRGFILTDNAFTTLAFVTRDAKGEREFSFARKPGADTLLEVADIDFGMIDATTVLHFGCVCMTDEPARSTHHTVVEYARKIGKLVTFDPNLREPLWKDLQEAKEQMFWGFAHADVVKISDNEVEFLFGVKPAQGAEILLKQYGVKLAFVTLGRDGCYYQNQNACGHVPGYTNLDPVDTTGAGDIFGGSAIYGILQSGKQPEALSGDELKKIADFACVAASLSTKKLGGISSVPEMADVRAIADARN